MTKLTPAQQESLYDAERNGSMYSKPAQQPGDLLTAVFEYMEQVEADEADTPLSDTERQVLDILLARQAERERGIEAGRQITKLIQQGDEAAIGEWIDQHLPADTDMSAILEKCDSGERKLIDERFDAIIDRVAVLPDAQRAQAIALWEGFAAGVGAA